MPKLEFVASAIFPSSSSSVDPCSAALSLSDSVPCGISAYSASCIWAQQRAQLFIGPGFRKELGLLFFRAGVCLFLYKKQWWENMRETEPTVCLGGRREGTAGGWQPAGGRARPRPAKP